MDEQELLKEIYEKALALYQNSGEPPPLLAQNPEKPYEVVDYTELLQVIIDHQEQPKAVLAVLTTLLVKKLHTPSQDIRLHQANMEGGFSGRGLDTRVVTPFLRDQHFPHMSESGWLTRSLEQSRPYDLDYPGSITPTAVKQAFLKLVDGVQCQGLPATNVLLALFVGLIQFRDQNTSLILSRPVNLTVAQVVDKISRGRILAAYRNRCSSYASLGYPLPFWSELQHT